MIDTEVKQYSYNDLVIVPAYLSSIKSRKECNVEDSFGYLPLFTAPMSSVVDNNNFQLFEDNKIHSILPRTENIIVRLNHCYNNFAAFSLSEFEEYFVNWDAGKKRYALIDIANGHMKYLFDLVEKARETNKNQLVIMIGNIANPDTYRYCISKGIDYVRCGIGTGFGCTTSTNVGVHYAPGSLIDSIFQIKKDYVEIGYTDLPKIVADGGIRNFSDIIKALALGADYVMCGYVFTKMVESAAKTTIVRKIGESFLTLEDLLKTDEENIKQYIRDKKIQKLYYGMSTKRAQSEMGNKILKTSEGVQRIINAEYTMKGWIENFVDYLRSAMSYCDSRTLEEFKNKTKLVPLSANSFNLINK